MKYLIPSILMMWLAGCSVLPEKTPVQLYRLPSPTLDSTPAAHQQVVEVHAPRADRLLASEHIVVWPATREVSVYADAAWHDNLPALLQRQWQDALLASGVALPSGPGEPHSDVRLVTRLNDFHIVYRDRQPVAVMRAHLVLLDATSGQRLASQQLSASQAAQGESIPQAVDALGAVSEQLTRELVDWLDQQLNL